LKRVELSTTCTVIPILNPQKATLEEHELEVKEQRSAAAETPEEMYGSTDIQTLLPPGKGFTLYPRRWIMLCVIVFIQIGNAMVSGVCGCLWLCVRW
jgi:hypothetical protein